MIIELDENDKILLDNMGFGPGEYPAEKGNLNDFGFPSKKEDFKLHIFEKEGKLFAEFPDSIEPAYKGNVLDLVAGEDISGALAGKIIAYFV